MAKHSSVVEKIDRILSETNARGVPIVGHRPIQFMKFWKNYRPGDRMNVDFAEDSISIFGTNSEGQFAGSKAEKELYIDDSEGMEEFRKGEGSIWNLV